MCINSAARSTSRLPGSAVAALESRSVPCDPPALPATGRPYMRKKGKITLPAERSVNCRGDEYLVGAEHHHAGPSGSRQGYAGGTTQAEMPDSAHFNGRNAALSYPERVGSGAPGQTDHRGRGA